MAITQELINILVCPETRQALSLAKGDITECFNEKVRGGKLKNKAENTVVQEVTQLLMREDGSIVYPIRDDIPVLLIEEGVATSELSCK